MTALWPWLLLGAAAGTVLGLVLLGHARLFRDPPHWRSGGRSMTIQDGQVRYTTPQGDEMSETPDIQPGFQQMLRALAEPDGLLTCSSARIPDGVVDMEMKGLIKPVHISTMKIAYAITDKGRAYVDRLG